MFSAPASGSSGPGSRPAKDSVLSWARLLTLTGLSPPRSIMGTGELLGKPNKLRGSGLRWTSTPSRGSRNTPKPPHAKETGICSGS